MTLFYNNPLSSSELRILSMLKQRMNLPVESLNRYHNLQKGFEGEVTFHQFLSKNLDSECIVLYDLLLDSNLSEFQIDCIIIQQREIWYVEVKNISGDFILKDDALISLATGKELNNPLHQINRGTRLLKELQTKHGYRFPVRSYVVFVHSEFALYHLQQKHPIVLPNQIHRFIHNINKTHSTLTPAHHKLAETLCSIQIPPHHPDQIPSYDFNSIKKGIDCLHCKSPLSNSKMSRKRITCHECGFSESHESIVLRSVITFHTLFPKTRITTKNIVDWCDGMFSKFKTRNILYQFFRPVGIKKNMHFLIPSRNES